MTTEIDLNLSASSDDAYHLERVEKIIRCCGVTPVGFPCNRFLTKIIFVMRVPNGTGLNGVSISTMFPGLEIKVGTETKCRRCKQMSYELTVI